ncbi:MAG: hypothetical protein R3C49_02065 [Planctomycetaceae bacterium]
MTGKFAAAEIPTGIREGIQDLAVSLVADNIVSRPNQQKRRAPQMSFSKITAWFKGSRRRNQALTGPAPAVVESLESRTLMSVANATLSSGRLTINANNTRTDVVVNKVGSNIVVTDNAPGGFFLTAPTWKFSASSVKSVKFVGGSAADTFVNNYSVPTEAWGNGGDDYLEGANADDVLLGGDGRDTLKGYGGNDRLYGGDGVDKLYGMDGNDSLYGGGSTSADQLWGGAGRDRFLTQTGDVIKDGSGINSLTGSDVQIRFADSSSASWSNTEIRMLDDAFQRLYDAVGNNRLLRDSASTEPLTITQENLTGDLGSNTDPYQKNDVWWSGPWWNRVQHIDRRTVARKIVIDEWDESSPTKNALMRDTLIHEFGHTWDNEHSGWSTWQGLSGWRTSAPSSSLASRYSKSKDGGWWYLKTAGFGLDYGKTNPKEDFATAWESYFIQRFSTTNTQGVSRLPSSKYNHLDRFFSSLS